MRLVDLRAGQAGTLSAIDLPERTAARLADLGFFPGSRVTAAWSAPGGDPRVYRIDGAEIALRREMAIHLVVEAEEQAGT